MTSLNSLSAIGASPATSQSPIVENPPTDAEKAKSDFDDFLQLLTAQLENQDPLKPLDSSEFVSQLAEFSNVEQQVKMNQKLDNLITSLTGNDFSDAGNYLGKSVTIDGGKIDVEASDRNAFFSYQTAQDIKSAKAIISDQSGKQIHTIALPLAPKGIEHEWNLANDQNERIDPGLYQITIETLSKDGITSRDPAQTRVKITQAHKTNDGFEFLTNTDQTIKTDDIYKIYASEV